MTTTTNNKNNIDTIVSETINTIIPIFINKILKNNKKVLDGVLQLLKEDEEIKTSMKKLVISNIPQPVVKVAKIRKSKNTKPKDADAPKKPKSAYLIFCQENRNDIKQKFPELLPKEILSKLGASWKEIRDEPAAKQYIKKANEERLLYDNEMSEYTPSDDYNKELADYNEKPENMKTKTKKNKKVDPHKPKKPQTIFFKFSKEMRNKVKGENPDMKSEDVAIELGRLWKNEVTQEEKDEYKEIFKTEMIEYKRLLEEYTNPPLVITCDEKQSNITQSKEKELNYVHKEDKNVSKKPIKQPKEEPVEQKKASKKPIKQPKEEPVEQKKASKNKTIKQLKEELVEQKKVSKNKTIKQLKEELKEEPVEDKKASKQLIVEIKSKIQDNNTDEDDDDNQIISSDDDDMNIVDDSDFEKMNNNTDDEEIIYDSD